MTYDARSQISLSFPQSIPAPAGKFPSPIATMSVWRARRRQRIALKKVLDVPHILADLNVSRDEAAVEANKPFWQI